MDILNQLYRGPLDNVSIPKMLAVAFIGYREEAIFMFVLFI
jgi:hypothetical protein